MKIIRNNICFVNMKDLVAYDFPINLKFDKEAYGENDFVILDEQDDIDYIRNREDIIDYDSVFTLSHEELEKKIREIEKDLEPLYIEFSSTSNESRKLLFEDEDFRSNLFKLDKIYYDLIHYKNNKEDEDEKIFEFFNNFNLSKSMIKS